MASRANALLLVASAAAMLAAGATAQTPERERPVPRRETPTRSAPARQRVFEGTSRRGSVDEALQNAVAAALRSLPGADRLVRYRVRDITGESGGIAGLNLVRVTIELPAETAGETIEHPADLTPAEIHEALELEVRVRPERPVRGESLTFELTVRNRGDRLVTLPFTNGKQFDFEVSRNGKPVTRWSTNRVFPQALSSVTVGPGQSITFSGRLSQRAAPTAPGTYRVRGFLPSAIGGLVLEDAATFTVAAK